jgi:hypothetical protein
VLANFLLEHHCREAKVSSLNQSRSLKIAQDWEKTGCRDSLLELLYSKDRHCLELQKIYEGLDEDETNLGPFVLAKEFPFLSRRLLELQRFSIGQNPRSSERQWNDSGSYHAIRIAVTIGAGALILSLLQLCFQIYPRPLIFSAKCRWHCMMARIWIASELSYLATPAKHVHQDGSHQREAAFDAQYSGDKETWLLVIWALQLLPFWRPLAFKLTLCSSTKEQLRSHAKVVSTVVDAKDSKPP